MQATRSLLRNAGSRHWRRSTLHISLPPNAGRPGAVVVDEHLVESHRILGEALWFSAPGAVVVCDGCDSGVHQQQGGLLGKPGKSQFAQDQFLCQQCMDASQSYREG